MNIRIECKSKDLKAEMTKAFNNKAEAVVGENKHGTCGVCWAPFKTRQEIHTQPNKWVCCRCLGHAYEECREVAHI